MTTDALILFVLDKSGSMGGVADATIAGFNAFMEGQVATPGKTWLSLVLFDTSPTARFTGANAAQVPPMAVTGVNSYQPTGGTALYDAVCLGIDAADAWITDASFDGKVFCVILTDGEENSSTRYHLDDVNDRIKDHQDNRDWEFVFLGSGGASWTEGRNMVIPATNVINYAGDVHTTAGVYAGLSSSMTNTRTTGTAMASTLAGTQAAFQADPALLDPSATPLTNKLLDTNLAGTAGSSDEETP